MILSLYNLPDLAGRTKLLEGNPFHILECMRDVKDDEAVILEDSTDCLLATLFFDIKKAFDTLNHDFDTSKNLKMRE